ncbi:hypothetical protein BHM03_00043918 [Ensete ventricosum]|nr:hypothetical protein BHM03_00043918 [Ensete ventricosum]
MKRHDLTLTSTRVHALDLCPRKLRASAPCFIFYVDSLHAAWILHQVPPKSLCSSIYIKLIVALVSTIPWVSPLLSSISASTLSVSSYDVALDYSPTLSRNASTNALPHSRSCDDSTSLARSVELYGDITLRNSSSICAVHCT